MVIGLVVVGHNGEAELVTVANTGLLQGGKGRVSGLERWTLEGKCVGFERVNAIAMDRVRENVRSERGECVM